MRTGSCLACATSSLPADMLTMLLISVHNCCCTVPVQSIDAADWFGSHWCTGCQQWWSEHSMPFPVTCAESCNKSGHPWRERESYNGFDMCLCNMRKELQQGVASLGERERVNGCTYVPSPPGQLGWQPSLKPMRAAFVPDSVRSTSHARYNSSYLPA